MSILPFKTNPMVAAYHGSDMTSTRNKQLLQPFDINNILIYLMMTAKSFKVTSAFHPN